MALDIKALRTETIGCTRVIHFNNAGASLIPDTVWNEVIEYTKQEALWGGYETYERRRQDLDEVYTSVASLINGKANEIAIVENATTAWNLAFASIPFKENDRILISSSEYASNYIAYLHLQKKISVSIEVIPNDDEGQVSVKELENMMDNHVRLISITHIPTNSGLVNPAEEIGKIAQDYGCLYLLDACQSVGQYPVDVQVIGCDFLSATGRKFLRAPRGTGFLFVKEEILSKVTPPFPDLHSAQWTGENTYKIREDARKFENWEFNFAAVAGLNQAVKYANNLGMKAIWKRIIYLAQILRKRLEEMDNITVHDIGKVKGGLVTFSHKNFSAGEVRQYLLNRNINVSLTSRQSTLIDMTNRNLEELVRASVHYYNTKQEIEILTEALRNMTGSN